MGVICVGCHSVGRKNGLRREVLLCGGGVNIRKNPLKTFYDLPPIRGDTDSTQRNKIYDRLNCQRNIEYFFAPRTPGSAGACRSAWKCLEVRRSA